MIPGVGLYGKGMHDFVMRELEIGFRAAAVEDSERCGWSALDDRSFLEYMAKNGADDPVGHQPHHTTPCRAEPYHSLPNPG